MIPPPNYCLGLSLVSAHLKTSLIDDESLTVYAFLNLNLSLRLLNPFTTLLFDCGVLGMLSPAGISASILVYMSL